MAAAMQVVSSRQPLHEHDLEHFPEHFLNGQRTGRRNQRCPGGASGAHHGPDAEDTDV